MLYCQLHHLNIDRDQHDHHDHHEDNDGGGDGGNYHGYVQDYHQDVSERKSA